VRVHGSSCEKRISHKGSQRIIMSEKAAKEAAVYGHSGTSVLEVAVLVAVMPLLLHASNSASFLEDVLGVAIPLLLAHTIGADHLPLGVWTIPLCCLLLNPRVYLTRLRHKSPVSGGGTLSGYKENYVLTVLRGTTVLSTVLAILAVDFPSVFPRRYVKTEWFGTSLMDIGVGAYVFTGAIVRGNKGSKSMLTSVKAAFPVIVLGLTRAIVNKSVDYQEHVSEYGCHWNFFITLAFVRLFGDVLCLISGDSRIAKLVLGSFLLLLHQVLLSSTVIGVWAMQDMDSMARKNESIAWQNKEGLISLMGYVALDLCTRGASEWILSLDGLGLLAVDVCLWASLWVTNNYIQKVSRRSANAPYVLWVCSIGVMIMFLSSWLLSPEEKRSELMRILSRHQLAIFLLSNILTGLVNLTFDTLDAPVVPALWILSGYAATVCTAGYLLEHPPSFLHRKEKSA